MVARPSRIAWPSRRRPLTSRKPPGLQPGPLWTHGTKRILGLGPIVQAIVCKLAKHDYVRTVRLNNGMLTDEYGTKFDDLGWYVKLLINQDDGEHDVVSCHLTKYPLTTLSETIDAFDVSTE